MDTKTDNEKRLSLEAIAARDRWAACASPSDTESWERAIAPLLEREDHARRVVTDLQSERATLAAEVKRLTETAEHLGANLKTARTDLAEAQTAVRRMAEAAVKREDEAASQRARADRLAAGIDALVERYSDLQRGAR